MSDIWTANLQRGLEGSGRLRYMYSVRGVRYSELRIFPFGFLPLPRRPRY